LGLFIYYLNLVLFILSTRNWSVHGVHNSTAIGRNNK